MAFIRLEKQGSSGILVRPHDRLSVIKNSRYCGTQLGLESLFWNSPRYSQTMELPGGYWLLSKTDSGVIQTDGTAIPIGLAQVESETDIVALGLVTTLGQTCYVNGRELLEPRLLGTLQLGILCTALSRTNERVHKLTREFHRRNKYYPPHQLTLFETPHSY